MSEDRIRDLGIMKPTRYQLRYHRNVLEPAESHKNNIRAFRVGGEAGGRVGRLRGGRAAIRHDVRGFGFGCGPELKQSYRGPAGLVDKASASGAGDSRFEAWAGNLGWPPITKEGHCDLRSRCTSHADARQMPRPGIEPGAFRSSI